MTISAGLFALSDLKAIFVAQTNRILRIIHKLLQRWIILVLGK